MVAAGHYIRTLRESRRLTQADVIERAAQWLNGKKIDSTTLWRIETGRKKTRSDILSAVVEAVEGNSDDVARLMNDPLATPADGEERARQWFDRVEIARMDRLIIETKSDDLDAVIGDLRQEYQHDPGVLTFLRGALAGWRARGGVAPKR